MFISLYQIVLRGCRGWQVVRFLNWVRLVILDLWGRRAGERQRLGGGVAVFRVGPRCDTSGVRGCFDNLGVGS